MPIPTPNLDDRSFADLVDEAQRIIRQRCPDWTDLTPSDPASCWWSCSRTSPT